ncbi:MAG: hypothetical protein ABIZ04_07725 [Opitutus sp.]
MNISTLTKAAGVSVGLLVSLLISAASAETYSGTHACSGATTVAGKTVRPQFPNGRGAMVTVQTGSKTTCRTCPVVTEVTTNALANGRGASKRTTVVQTGAEHTCTGCASTAKL